MMAQPSTSAEPNSILKVVQSGYELNGRLLAPGSSDHRQGPLKAHLVWCDGINLNCGASAPQKVLQQRLVKFSESSHGKDNRY
jgi:hypothetical protein